MASVQEEIEKRNAKRDGPSPARQIREALYARKDEVVPYLFPNAIKKGHEYEVGSLAGEPGHSLKVHANGKGGVYKDFATGESGADYLDLWKDVRCSGDLKAAMKEASDWLGLPSNGHGKPAAKVKVASKEHEVARWTFRDTEGKPWIEERRYETADGEKVFRHYDLKNNGKQFFGEHKIDAPYPLLNLHLLKEANEVVFGEGAKCATAFSQLGYAATTTLYGAVNADKADYSPLAGKTIILWPDNDEVGAKYADTVAKMVLAVGGKVRRVEIPEGKTEGWDVADAIAEGWTPDEVAELLAQAKEWHPERRLKAYSISELLALDIAPREYHLSPWLPDKGLALVHAWRGVGKTYFGLSVGHTMAATGSLFGKWEAKEPRRVLYIDGELPGRVIQDRLTFIIKGAKHEADPAYFRVIASDLEECGIPDLATKDGQVAVEEWLADYDVLMLDNLSCLVRSGIENDAEGWTVMQEWLLSLRRQKKSVVMFHHSGNSGKQRGTTKREDILDAVINLRHPKDYRFEQGARFEVHFEKARGIYGDDVKPFEVQLHDKDGAAVWTVKSLEAVEIEQVAAFARDGFTQRDIAKELGCSVGKVNKLMASAKRQNLL